jgi:phosphohistidine phosphatase
VALASGPIVPVNLGDEMHQPPKEPGDMAIYLVQHGKALSKDAHPDRPLSPGGIADVERIAGVAAGYSVRVTEIHHSGKLRAQQTAEILARHLKPAGGVTQKPGLGPNDDVVSLAESLSPADGAMLVGHLPSLERLTAQMVTGVSERPVFAFQNGGIVCLDHYPGTRDWIIKWALMPSVG